MAKYGEYIADDRLVLPEYLERIRNITDAEFEQHINELKQNEE